MNPTAKARKPRTAIAKVQTPPAPAMTSQQQFLALLRRPEGATIATMAETLGWQHHSVRGFLAGTVKKKLGLNLASEKTEAGRIYRIIDGATA